VVFRDMKPHNLLLDRHGRLKLTDLGLALVLGTDGQTANSKAGTRGYWAPEVVRREVDWFPGDWFSLGVTMYGLLSMHSPFSLDVNLERRSIHFAGLDVASPNKVATDKEKSIEQRRQRHEWHDQLVLELDPPCAHTL
jgi:serine/threonine protein kinase